MTGSEETTVTMETVKCDEYIGVKKKLRGKLKRQKCGNYSRTILSYSNAPTCFGVTTPSSGISNDPYKLRIYRCALQE
jgi:hypothetical protein